MAVNENAQAFLNRLEQENIKPGQVYETENASVVRLGVSGKHVRYEILYFFQPKNFVQILVPELAAISGDKRLLVLEKLNEMNFKYSWLKFVLDPESRLHIMADAAVTPETAGEIGFQFLSRCVFVLDEIYPELMHSVWY